MQGKLTVDGPTVDGLAEDQLASMGLVLNAVVLCNTRYLDAAIATLRGLLTDQR
ncbi:hypothetical protein [Streptomyces sp. NPDC006463]|uniref:hypothetical protein n=1 Tax=Streptomyces sp. NPDC006463 TaxID=3364746 RepID=UPI003695AC8D